MFDLIVDVPTLMASATIIAAMFAIPLAALAAFWGGGKLVDLAKGFFG